jgi:hypothetical protein
MIQPPFRTLLMAAVGGAALPEPRLAAAIRPAVALPAIAGGAEEK